MDTVWSIYESPLGPLTLVASGRGVTAIRFPGESPPPGGAVQREMPLVTSQLDEYFAGERQRFELALDRAGSPLQRLVWERLGLIPYGETISYGELARDIDGSAYPAEMPDHERVRTAAAAVGRTPTPVLVPCHRVIGADGSLTGYGGGLERKRALLDLERGTVSLFGPAFA